MIDMHAHLGYYKLFPNYFIDDIVNSIYSKLPQEEQNSHNLNMISQLTLSKMNDLDGSRMIQQALKAGIEKLVLLIIDFYDNKNEDNEFTNLDWIHETHFKVQEKYPQNIILFAGIDPRRGKKGLDFFEKCIKKYNCKGLKLYPPCGFELNTPELFPFYELCESFKLPVLTHTGPSLKHMKISDNYSQSVKEVVHNFKNLKLILGHGGVLYLDDNLELAKFNKNIYLDISGFQREQKATLEKKFQILIENIPDKVVFGSDWPLFNFNATQSYWLSKLTDIKCLTDYYKSLLFKKNAEHILSN